LQVDWTSRLDQPATAMDPQLIAMLARALERTGAPMTVMSSGAGHDAMVLAPYMRTAMLFIRTPGGISHHPDESVHENDVAIALAAGMNFLDELAASGSV
jgi:allantoate deiminase